MSYPLSGSPGTVQRRFDSAARYDFDTRRNQLGKP